MAFDVKQKLKIELFEVCRIVALFHNREKERETERDRESNALMSCFKHVIVSCIKLYASASWSLQTMGCKAARYVFHHRTCVSFFINRIWYKFRVSGRCLFYNSDFKLFVKEEHTFFFVILLYPGTRSAVYHFNAECFLNLSQTYSDRMFSCPYCPLTFCSCENIVTSSFLPSTNPDHIANILFSRTLFSGTGEKMGIFS